MIKRPLILTAALWGVTSAAWAPDPRLLTSSKSEFDLAQNAYAAAGYDAAALGGDDSESEAAR